MTKKSRHYDPWDFDKLQERKEMSARKQRREFMKEVYKALGVTAEGVANRNWAEVEFQLKDATGKVVFKSARGGIRWGVQGGKRIPMK